MLSNPRFRKFFSFYKPYKRLFAMDMLCSLLVSVIAIILPLLVRYITQDVLNLGMTAAMDGILRVGSIILLLIVIQTACTLFYDYKGHSMGAMMERDMRAQLFEQYQKLSFRFYDHKKVGELMSRLTNDLLSITELYHHGPEDLLIYLLQFFGAMIVLLHTNRSLALVTIAFLPIMLIYSFVFNKRLRHAYSDSRQRIADVDAQVEENLSGIRVVKSFANENLEQQKFAQENQAYCNSRIHIYRNEAYYYSAMETFFVQLITFSLVLFGGIWITRDALTLPDLILFLMYIAYLTAPIPQLARIIPQYQDGISGFNRFMDIMDMEPEPYDEPGKLKPDSIKGDVAFHDVSFRYQDDVEYVLHHLDLNVAAGEYVALVGTSGVGKTTLCSLIPRFYEVSEGRITLDGVDIRDIDLGFLRRAIGVVQQDVYLFSGTVLDNIRYGQPNASMEDVIKAAKKANAHDFIAALPDGYETQIGQRGVRLSGGQKQRLSIARVLLKDPPVLIFDEATSALDNESERVVHESLTQLSKGRTTFVIAHRLSTIRNAQRILVLTEQGIEEQGTHDQLIAQNGAYARLYNQSL
ncbi:ABC transporter ATP-binding protein/permease [Eubacteriales bacterium OttesenSCG-928-N13]|nr:ABC transporter ATP-binding protein/permease [Eubacteriales bacterium OttesenSCG-928-N13]